MQRGWSVASCALVCGASFWGCTRDFDSLLGTADASATGGTSGRGAGGAGGSAGSAGGSGGLGGSAGTLVDGGSGTAGAPPDAGCEPGYAGAVMCDGPLGYWRLGEPTGTALIKNEVPGGLNGNAMNVQGVPGAIFGDSNGAAGFPENVAADIKVPDDVAANYGFFLKAVFSVEFWVRVPAGATSSIDRNIVARYAGSNGWEIFFPDGAGTVRFKRGSVDPWDSTTTQSSLNDGTWHHVVAVYDGTQLLFYVDAAPQGAMAATQSITSHQKELVIGASDALSSTFTREIDEVAIYGHVLDAQTVLRHYCLGTTGQPSC